LTFLILEDDRSIAEFLENILAGKGYHCLHAASTRQADLVLATIHVEAITLDLGLPGPPGQSALHWLEEIAIAQPDLTRCTLVLTGRDPDDEELQRIEKTGAGLLLKPCPGAEILDFFEKRFRTLKRRKGRSDRGKRRGPPPAPLFGSKE
jgi:DNA-binding response OmpR family regulator